MSEDKVDLKQDYKPLFNANNKEVNFVGIPPFNFLMIDGIGNPKTAVFKNSIKALYSIAYAIKSECKNNSEIPDFTVPPLEGLWWSEKEGGIDLNDKENWQWTLMIMMPEFVTNDMFVTVKETVQNKKETKYAEKVRFELFDEGPCAQIMHIGPYSEETKTLSTIYQVIKDAGFKVNGKHHEIYLSDPNRGNPEKLKTIIRLPIIKKVIPKF